jgi:hypothetical protein
LSFTSVLTALALIWSARPAEAAASASSDTSGTWTATGDLVSRSFACAAALLADGKVLVAGYATNSEVYDVTSGKWTLTKPLNQRRFGAPTLTLLANGMMLATGGYNSAHGGPLSSAELFDPAYQTWTNTRVMNSAHLHHTATLLPNGKVLVTGNCNGSNDVAKWGNEKQEIGRMTRVTIMEHLPPWLLAGTNALASAELYDPPTGTWKCTASLKQPRGHHTATLLTNGSVLVVGGKNPQGAPLSSAELYDPDSETWTEVGVLELARGYHTATLLTTGQVLVVGGQDAEGNPFSEAELYDPATRQWRPTRGTLFPRSYHTATLLTNGQVMVAGGSSGTDSLKFVELYNPATGAWSRARPMATARTWHTATLLKDGKVLVAGGVRANWSDPLSKAELFDPSPRER